MSCVVFASLRKPGGYQLVFVLCLLCAVGAVSEWGQVYRLCETSWDCVVCHSQQGKEISDDETPQNTDEDLTGR